MIKVYRDINMNERVYRYNTKPKAKKYRAYYMCSNVKLYTYYVTANNR